MTTKLIKNILIAFYIVVIVAGYDIAHTPKVLASNLEVPVAIPKPEFGPTNIKKVVTYYGTPTPPLKPITVADKIKKTFPANSTMLKVAYCESKFNPRAKNPKGTATGVFQIISSTWKSNKCIGDPTNADDNIACAKKIYEKEDTRPWVSSIECWKK
jgi:hypothetical protein